MIIHPTFLSTIVAQSNINSLYSLFTHFVALCSQWTNPAATSQRRDTFLFLRQINVGKKSIRQQQQQQQNCSTFSAVLVGSIYYWQLCSISCRYLTLAHLEEDKKMYPSRATMSINGS
jgi:hypothetical protein